MTDIIEWDNELAKLQIKVAVEKITAGTIKGMEKAALFVEGEVKKTAPVDTGQYRVSIRAEPAEVTDTSVLVAIGTTMPQACRLEFGYIGPDKLGRTFSQAPRPHWRPAFDNAERINSIIAAEIRKEKGE